MSEGKPGQNQWPLATSVLPVLVIFAKKIPPSQHQSQRCDFFPVCKEMNASKAVRYVISLLIPKMWTPSYFKDVTHSYPQENECLGRGTHNLAAQ